MLLLLYISLFLVMVIKRETLEALEKSSIVSIIMSLISAQFLDDQNAYENEMLVEYLLATTTATTVAATDPSSDIVASSSETRSDQVEEVTLNEQLLCDFQVQDSRKSDLNRQHDRVVSHSIGMQSRIPQVIRREAKKRKAEDPSKPEICNKKLIDEEEKSDLDLVNEIGTLKNCCVRCSANSNCIMKHFTVNVAGSSSSRFDFTALCKFVRRYYCFIFILPTYYTYPIMLLIFVHLSARVEKGGRDGDELDGFIQEKFRSVIVGDPVINKSGEKHFNLKWQHKGKELCRKSFCLLFALSHHRFDKCSKMMKDADSTYLSSLHHQPWKDDHVHDFTFAETEALFKENVRGVKVVDEEWVQASLSPTAEAQQFCIVWFKKYFDKFGDRAPNRFETYLIITARRVVYHQYIDEFTRSSRPFVKESVFTNIWNAVFPRYIDRPWCDIPGKQLFEINMLLFCIV